MCRPFFCVFLKMYAYFKVGVLTMLTAILEIIFY